MQSHAFVNVCTDTNLVALFLQRIYQRLTNDDERCYYCAADETFLSCRQVSDLHR
jgi:hypothetical protein